MDISCLFYKLLDGPVELVDGLPVMVLHRLHNTVLQVVFQDHLAGIVQGAAHSSQLDEHLGAVPPLLHHGPAFVSDEF